MGKKMKKYIVSCTILLLCACQHSVIIHRYRFETIGDAFVCVDNQSDGKYDSITDEIIEENDGKIVNKAVMDSYDECVRQLPLPVNFVEKKKDGTTVCYDKNNKIELPILYCQKDHNVSVMVNVDNNISMKQMMSVSQRNALYF